MALPAGRYGVTKRQLNKVKNLPVNTIGMIEAAAEAVTDLTKSTIGWLTQNELKLPYYSSSVSGDITATVNSDGTITLSSGTAITQEILYIRYKSEEFKPDAGTYKISKGFTNGKIGLVCEGYNGDTLVKVLASSFSNDEITFDIDYVGYDRISIYLNIQSGAVSEGITVVPILEHLTVSELMDTKANVTALATKADNSVVAPVENGATCANPDGYAVGEHFIRNDAFCTAKQPISSGGTLTEGTNYTSGDVAQSLVYTVDYAITNLSALSWNSPSGSQLSYASALPNDLLPNNAKIICAIICEPWGSSIDVFPFIAIASNNRNINLIIKQSDTPGSGNLSVRLTYLLL